MNDEQKPTLIMTVGLPQSGKSTWADGQPHPIVCPDDIRLGLHGQAFIGDAEPFVWAIARTMVKAYFARGHKAVVLDATNNTRKRRDEWISSKWLRHFASFRTSVETCIDRAEAFDRTDLIPVIRRMAEQHEPVTDDEQTEHEREAYASADRLVTENIAASDQR